MTRLTHDEQQNLADYINGNRAKFQTKAECFKSALAETGIGRKIKFTSSAVSRYFELANEQQPKADKAKRAYRRKAKTFEQHVNFCPHCGCNLQSVAMGMVMGGSR